MELSRLTEQLPICSQCKRVRLGNGQWQDLEQYLRARLQADFDQAVCPECRESRGRARAA